MNVVQQYLSFGAWLEKKRGAMSLRDFATITGIDVGTISRKREFTEIRLETALRVCWGLGFSLADLFADWLGRTLPAQRQMGRLRALLARQQIVLPDDVLLYVADYPGERLLSLTCEEDSLSWVKKTAVNFAWDYQGMQEDTIEVTIMSRPSHQERQKEDGG